MVTLDRLGLQTDEDPVGVRVLSRAQAAARETLHSALDGTPPSWDRLIDLALNATIIRDTLRVPAKLRGDERRGPSSAAYALAAGIALYGIPDGLTASALRRSVRAIAVDDVVRAWGGAAVPTRPELVVQSLLGTPGSGALIRIEATGSGRPVLGWLVSRPDGLAWIDPELDGGAAVRLMPPQDAVALLRATPGANPATLWVDAQGRPAAVTTASPAAGNARGVAEPDPAPGTPGISRATSFDSVFSGDTVSSTDTASTGPEIAAQDRPDLPVEVALGLSAADIRQYMPWLPRINPKYRTDLTYEQNCVLVALALDMSLASAGDPRQLPVEADGTNGPLRIDLLETAFPGHRFEPADDLAQIAAAMTRNADGKMRRGIVVVRGAGETVSHAFNVVSLGKQFAFLDGQSQGRPRVPKNIAEIRFLPTTDGIPSIRPAAELPADMDPDTVQGVVETSPVRPEDDRAGMLIWPDAANPTELYDADDVTPEHPRFAGLHDRQLDPDRGPFGTDQPGAPLAGLLSVDAPHRDGVDLDGLREHVRAVERTVDAVLDLFTDSPTAALWRTAVQNLRDPYTSDQDQARDSIAQAVTAVGRLHPVAGSVLSPLTSALGLRTAALARLGVTAVAFEYADVPLTAGPVKRPDLTDAAERTEAVQRVTRWTGAVQLPPGMDGPGVLPPEDCVQRAWGAFITVHRRSGNVPADAGMVESATVEALATRLGGKLTALTDADGLLQEMRRRPGTMALVHTPRREGGVSHVFWVMATATDELTWLDSQRPGISERTAAASPAELEEHVAELRQVGTRVLLLDENGRAEERSESPQTVAALLDPPLGLQRAGAPLPPPPPPPSSMLQRAQALDAWMSQSLAHPAYQSPEAAQQLWADYNARNRQIKLELLRRLAMSVTTSWGQVSVVANSTHGSNADKTLLLTRYFPQVGQVNVDSGTTNCVSCSIALDSMFDDSYGVHLLAQDTPEQSLAAASIRLRQPFYAFRDSDAQRVLSGSAGVVAEVNAQGHGFRGVVAQTANMNTGSSQFSGHMFNVINEEGYVLVLDSQSRWLGTLPDLYSRNAQVAQTLMLTTAVGPYPGITIPSGGSAAVEFDAFSLSYQFPAPPATTSAAYPSGSVGYGHPNYYYGGTTPGPVRPEDDRAGLLTPQAGASGSELPPPTLPVGLEQVRGGTDLAAAVTAAVRSTHPGLNVSGLDPAADLDALTQRHDLRVYVFNADGVADRYGRDGAPEVYLARHTAPDGGTSTYAPLAPTAGRTSRTVIDGAELAGAASRGLTAALVEPGQDPDTTLARAVSAELRKLGGPVADWDLWRPSGTDRPGIPLVGLLSVDALHRSRAELLTDGVDLVPAPREGTTEVPDELRDVTLEVRANRAGPYRPSGISGGIVEFSGPLQIAARVTGLRPEPRDFDGVIGPVLHWDTVTPAEPAMLINDVVPARRTDRAFDLDQAAWSDGRAMLGGVRTGQLAPPLNDHFMLSARVAAEDSAFPQVTLRNLSPAGMFRIGGQFRYVAHADVHAETVDPTGQRITIHAPDAVEVLLDLPAAAAAPDGAGTGARAAPPGYLAQETAPGGVDEARWRRVTAEPAYRLTRIGLEALRSLPGSSGIPADRLLHWIETLGRTPYDIAETAARTGLLVPGPMLDLAVDLGVDPRALVVFGRQIRELSGTGPVTRDRLLDRLVQDGIRTLREAVHLSEIGARLDLDESALPALISILGEGVPPELLLALPDSSLAVAVDTARLRHDIATAADHGAAALGLRDRLEVTTIAEELDVAPAHLAAVASYIRTALDTFGDPYAGADGDRLQSRPGPGFQEYRERDDAGVWTEWRALPLEPGPAARLRDGLAAQSTARGRRVAGEIRRLLSTEGRASDGTLSRYVTLSARLGVPVTDLQFLLPSRHVELLMHEFFGDVPLELLRVQWSLLLPEAPAPSAELMSGLPRRDYSAAEMAEWRYRLGDVGEEAFTDFLAMPWGDPENLMAAATRAGLDRSHLPSLLRLSAEIGWIPTELGRIAFWSGTTGAQFLRVAEGGRVALDPADLTAFGNLIRDSVAADTEAGPVRIRDNAVTRQLIDTAQAYSPVREGRLREAWLLRQTARWSSPESDRRIDVHRLGLRLSRLTVAPIRELALFGADLEETLALLKAAAANGGTVHGDGPVRDLISRVEAWAQKLRQTIGDDLDSVLQAEFPMQWSLTEPLDRLRSLDAPATALRESAARATEAETTLAGPLVEQLDEAASRRSTAVNALSRVTGRRGGPPLSDGPAVYSAALNHNLAHVRALAAYAGAALRAADSVASGPLHALADRLDDMTALYARGVRFYPVQRAADTLTDAEIGQYLADLDDDRTLRLTDDQINRAGELWAPERWATSLGIPASTLRTDYLKRPWLEARRLMDLSELLKRGTQKIPDLAVPIHDLAVAIHRLPDGISEVARRAGQDPETILDVARLRKTDPAALHVLDMDVQELPLGERVPAVLKAINQAAAADRTTGPLYLSALATAGFTHETKPDGPLWNRTVVLSRLLGVDLDLIRPDAARLTSSQVERWHAMVDDLVTELRLDRHEIATVAARLLVPASWVRASSVRLGRVPVELPDLAQQLGIHDGAKLLALAERAGVHPSAFVTEDGLSALNDVRSTDQSRFDVVGRVYREHVVNRLDEIRSRPGARPGRTWDGSGIVLPAVTDALWTIFKSAGFRPSALPRNLAALSGRSGLDVRDLAFIGSELGLTLDRTAFAAQYLTADSKVSTDPRERLLEGYRPWRDRLRAHAHVREEELAWANDLVKVAFRAVGLQRLTEMPARAAREFVLGRRLRDGRLTSGAIADLVRDHPGDAFELVRTAADGIDFPAQRVPVLLDLPLPANADIVLTRPGGATGLPDGVDQAAGSVRLDRETGSMVLPVQGLRNGWRSLGALTELVFGGPHAQVPAPGLAALRITTGFGTDTAAYLRLARLFHAHLPVLHRLGVIAPGGPAVPSNGWASFAELRAAHDATDGPMRLDLASPATGAAVFRLGAVGTGQFQAAITLFGAMVDAAREPGRFPGLTDLPFPGAGEPADDEAARRLLSLVDDVSARVQLAILFQRDGAARAQRTGGPETISVPAGAGPAAFTRNDIVVEAPETTTPGRAADAVRSPATTVRERVVALRDEVRAVESRVTEILERNPAATDVAMVWRTAVGSLTSFAEQRMNTIDDALIAAELGDIRLLVDQAATGILELDESARSMLAPLLTGTPVPETTVELYPVQVDYGANQAVASTVDNPHTTSFPPRLSDMPSWIYDRITRGQMPIPYYIDDAMDEAASKVGFGLEIEFVIPADDRFVDEDGFVESDSVAERLETIGRRLYELGLTYSEEQQPQHSDPVPGKWAFERDNTVDGEIISPILTSSPETWRTLLEIERILAEAGATVEVRDPIYYEPDDAGNWVPTGQHHVLRASSHVHVSSGFLSRYAGADGYARLAGLFHQHREVLYRLGGNARTGVDHGYEYRAVGWDADYPYLPDGQTVIDAHREKKLGLSFFRVQLLPDDHPEWRLWQGSELAAMIQAQVKLSIGTQLASLNPANEVALPAGPPDLGRFHTPGTPYVSHGGWRIFTPQSHAEYEALTALLSTVFARPADIAQAAALFYLNDWAPDPNGARIQAPPAQAGQQLQVDWPVGMLDTTALMPFLGDPLPVPSMALHDIDPGEELEDPWRVGALPVGMAQLGDSGIWAVEYNVTPTGQLVQSDSPVLFGVTVEGGTIRLGSYASGQAYSFPPSLPLLSGLVRQYIDVRSPLQLVPQGSGRLPQAYVKRLLAERPGHQLRERGVRPGDVLIPANFLLDPPPGVDPHSQSLVRFSEFQGQVHVSVASSAGDTTVYILNDIAGEPTPLVPETADGVRAVAAAARSRWDAFRSRADAALDAALTGTATDVQRTAARSARSSLGMIRSGLDRLTGSLPAGAAEGILQSLILTYETAERLMSEVLRGATPIPPAATMFSRDGGLPSETVGIAPDGSYVVATPEDDFRVYGPDGRARGTMEVWAAEGADWSGAEELKNHSDVPGALDLTTFYITARSSRPFFRSVDVTNPRVQQIRRAEYGMTELSAPGEEYQAFVLDRTRTNAIARARLESRGWTLPADGAAGRGVSHPAWTSEEPGWAPVAADGTRLTVITETLDGGMTRRVAGRHAEGGTFDVVHPATGAVVRRLYPWTGAGGDARWTVAPLSDADARYYRAFGDPDSEMTAEEMVQIIVDRGERVRADLVLPGFALYRMTVDGDSLQVRAMLDADGRVVRAQRPLPIDEDQLASGNDRLITELYDAGWMIRAGYDHQVDAATRIVTVNPYKESTAWRRLTEAHRVRRHQPGGPAQSGPGDVTVLMQHGTMPPAPAAGTMPPYTVGVAPDGSYVVAKAPRHGDTRPYGFSGFDVFGPDGSPRGTLEASTKLESNFAGTYQLNNRSDVPGALDLVTYYVASVATTSRFQFMSVVNEKLQRTLQTVYGMEMLSSSSPDKHDYRLSREKARDIARERLKSRGWTLGGGDFATPQMLRPAWTSTDPNWVPARQLRVVTETMDGGMSRRVSGRPAEPNRFQIIDPGSGAEIYELWRSTGPGGRDRWTAAPLSPTDTRFYAEIAEEIGAESAMAVVQSVVTDGERLRDDLTLPGFALYRKSFGDDGDLLIRVMVDAKGQVVRARRPLELDIDQFLLVDRDPDLHDGRDLMAELRGAGWTIRLGHVSQVNQEAKTLTLDPYHGLAWPRLTAAYRRRFEATATGSRFSLEEPGGPGSSWDHHQVWRMKVEQRPPDELRMLDGGSTQERIDSLTEQVFQAEPRISEVLEKFPSSPAAKSWRDALQGLDRLTGTPGPGDVTEVVRGFVRAAADVIRLDRTAAGALSKLSLGLPAPAREVPPPRGFGDWTVGDLPALAAGLKRPVLTSDLSGTTSHALDQLESALREHEWWGEVPIVVTSMGTQPNAERLDALREQYRPVIIQQSMTSDLQISWKLLDQDGSTVAETKLTRKLFEAASALPATPHGTALPPVLAGLLTAGPGAAEFHRDNAQQLTDPGVRDALDHLIATAPDGERLAGFRVALGLDAAGTEKLVPAATSLLGVEPPYTGGPVPASFAYDFLAQTGGRNERFPMDGLLFQIVLAGRMSPDAALELLRATARTAVDRAVIDVFQSVADVMTLTEEQAAANPHTDARLVQILRRVKKVSSTARKPGTPPPDCVDPVDRTVFVGRLDALRYMLRDSGQAARASLIETLTYILANC
ncbi:hypothetical protein JCM9534A_75070 [Catenuloplanes indicus JCM 9534]